MARRLGVASHELGGSGPLLLIMHANGFHGRAYLPLVPILSNSFRCVALDLPGHGNAPEPDGPFTAEDLLGSVMDFVIAHNIRDCYCFGHSLGGAMAALLEMERPGTFRAMFLFEPVLRPAERLDPPSPPVVNPAAPSGAGSSSSSSSNRDGGNGSVGSSGRTAGGGCSPSPSLVATGTAGPSGGTGAGAGGPSGSTRAPSLLARIARRRQACFPSVDAAKTALGAKPPFNAFHPQALHAYLACGGLRPAAADTPPTALTTQPTTATTTTTTGPVTNRTVCLTNVGGAPSSSSAADAGSSSGWVLACAPESEARVYEALDPPPWRPWNLMGRGRGGGGGGGEGEGENGVAESSGGGGGAAGGDQGRDPRGCRVAVAVGSDAGGLHAHLARWGAEVAAQVPRGQLIRFPSLGHLGPMEDPAAVATVLRDFLLESLGSGLGSGLQEGGGAGRPAIRSSL